MFTRKCIRSSCAEMLTYVSTHITTAQIKTENIPSSPTGSLACPLPDNSPHTKETSILTFFTQMSWACFSTPYKQRLII